MKCTFTFGLAPGTSACLLKDAPLITTATYSLCGFYRYFQIHRFSIQIYCKIAF